MIFLSAMRRSLLLSLGLICCCTSVVAGESETAPADVHFNIWEFQVEGATLLPRASVEGVVYPFMGSNKTLADVEAAKSALEQLYRDAGYAAVLVNIPEQEANEGVIRLTVTESKIDRFRITGTRYSSPRDLRAEIPALQPGTPLHLPTLQAQLAQAGRLAPERVLNPVFRPGLEPGTMEAELKVEDGVPLHASLGFNNRYTLGSSHLRMEMGLSYANLWQRHHNISVNYQASPQNWEDVRVWSLGYSIPVDEAYWNFSAVRSASHSAAFGSLGVLGNSDIYGINWQYPLSAKEGVSQGISLGVQYKDQQQNVLLPDGNGISTPISYSVAQAQFNRSQKDDTGVTSYSLGASFGLRPFSDNLRVFDDKRSQSRPSFTHFNGDIERLQAGFMKTTWRLHLAAQLSDSPLISNEQFNAGGAGTVRGYPESQVMGDDAVLANVELRSPPLMPAKWSSLYDLQLLVFADSAWLKRHNSLAYEASRQHLAGVGIGARLVIAKSINAVLDWATPLEDAGSIKRSDARTHFNVRYEF